MADSRLSTYRAKRDFRRTTEPGGAGTIEASKRLRYVVQKHAARQMHYDLRLELDGVFRSWAVARGPSPAPENKRLAVEVEDHPLEYGDFEGTIQAGRGRAPKPFMLASRNPARADAVWNSARAARKGSARVSDRESSQEAGRKTARPRGAQMPTFIEPALCKGVARVPSGSSWGHEIKLDGYRLQLRVQRNTSTLKTRTGLDWSERFETIAAAAQALPDCIIDGEVVALDEEGVSDFGALQAALADKKTGELIFFGFDLLHLQGEDLRPRPLRERKRRLQTLLYGAGPNQTALLRYAGHVEGAGAEVLDAACRMNLEGIISKRLDSAYRSGRIGDWVKTKCRTGHEVVIGGWTGSDELRSLLVGVYHGNRLIHVGRVGTGFSRKNANALQRRLASLARKSSPFEGPNAPREAGVRWVQPRLVAEIEFAGWTGAGNVRQAAFKGLREDKPARAVVAQLPRPARQTTAAAPMRTCAGAKVRRQRGSAEAASPEDGVTDGESAVMGVEISNPEKALWPKTRSTPAITKLELARYFQTVGPWMLEHLRGRPCSIVRAPDGIGHETFFQRHAMTGTPRMLTQVQVSGDRKPFLQVDTPEALAALAQLAAIELHPWNCLPEQPEVPGRLVFDLDPGPDVPFDTVVAAAKEMKERLEALGLVAYCKTTGGKGLHVVTPLAPSGRHPLSWADAKTFAHGVCAHMAQDSPDRYVLNMAKKLRVGRIFLDYLRNDRLSTAVAPLSPRARPGAPVSMPLNWTQVRAGLDPMRYTLHTVPALLARSGAWQAYRDHARPLASAMRKLLESHDARTPARRR